ncbi:MAG: hypothetical protein K9L68_03205 [Spirochaetales bacterium]|nr:hypothetical protein [Spirochaetales bacterium]MCF7937585.1 hypothetical protein [Spirochaetales bacterium]
MFLESSGFGRIELTKDPRFPVKAQGGLGGWIGFGSRYEEIPLRWTLRMGLHNSLQSGPEGGYLYRGHWGFDTRLLGGFDFYRSPEQSPPSPDLTIGSNIGVFTRYDFYSLTPLAFFYPGLSLEPYAALQLGPHSPFELEFQLPFDWYLRKDLDYNIAWSFVLALRYSFIEEDEKP